MAREELEQDAQEAAIIKIKFPELERFLLERHPLGCPKKDLFLKNSAQCFLVHVFFFLNPFLVLGQINVHVYIIPH